MPLKTKQIFFLQMLSIICCLFSLEIEGKISQLQEIGSLTVTNKFASINHETEHLFTQWKDSVQPKVEARKKLKEAVQYGIRMLKTDLRDEPTFSSTPCEGGKHGLLTIMTDDYGADTSWSITNSDKEEVEHGSDYISNELYEIDICLDDGNYVFTVSDSYGDGICCNMGNGYYKLEVDGYELFIGGEFSTTETKYFKIGQFASSKTCKDWCHSIPIPFKSHSGVNKCDFEGHCNTCEQCLD